MVSPTGHRPDEKRGLGESPSARLNLATLLSPLLTPLHQKTISQKCFLKKLMIFFGNVKEKQ
jgi:hypothetical protein